MTKTEFDCWNHVLWFFEGDQRKCDIWFNTANPALGNATPRQMIRWGREEKLRKFIVQAISENFRIDEEFKDWKKRLTDKIFKKQ